MKKMILVLLGMGFVFPCFGKEQPKKDAQAKCTINEYDCLQVAKTLDNPKELETMGLHIAKSELYLDTRDYLLSNNIQIGIQKAHQKALVAIGTAQGQNAPIQFPPCTLNGHNCKEVIEALDNPNRLKAINLEITETKDVHGFPVYTFSNGTTFSTVRPNRKILSFPNGEHFLFNSTNAIESYNFLVEQKEFSWLNQATPTCAINGHNCRIVFYLIDKTETISTTEKGKEKYHYKNPELQKIGLTVVNKKKFGFMKTYTLADGTIIRKDDVSHSKFSSIAFPNGETFAFSNGKVIRYTSPNSSQKK